MFVLPVLRVTVFGVYAIGEYMTMTHGYLCIDILAYKMIEIRILYFYSIMW